MRFDAGLVIFDLDGTLIDSSRDIAWSANRTLESLGYGAMDPAVIKEHIGWGVRPLLERLMPAEPPEKISEARLTFLQFYSTHLVDETNLYPGAIETIEHLRAAGKKLALVTNKPIGLTEGILKELGIAKYFLMVLGGDSLQNKKPHPEPIELVIRSLEVRPALSVVVGDSPVDCEAGKGAGARTIGAAYGFRGRAELEGAGCDVIIDKITELKDIIR